MGNLMTINNCQGQGRRCVDRRTSQAPFFFCCSPLCVCLFLSCNGICTERVSNHISFLNLFLSLSFFDDRKWVQRLWRANQASFSAPGAATASPSTGYATGRPTAAHPFPVSIRRTKIPSNVSGGYFHQLLLLLIDVTVWLNRESISIFFHLDSWCQSIPDSGRYPTSLIYCNFSNLGRWDWKIPHPSIGPHDFTAIACF